jgi:hypothetical protein
VLDVVVDVCAHQQVRKGRFPIPDVREQVETGGPRHAEVAHDSSERLPLEKVDRLVDGARHDDLVAEQS